MSLQFLALGGVGKTALASEWAAAELKLAIVRDRVSFLGVGPSAIPLFNRSELLKELLFPEKGFFTKVLASNSEVCLHLTNHGREAIKSNPFELFKRPYVSELAKRRELQKLETETSFLFELPVLFNSPVIQCLDLLSSLFSVNACIEAAANYVCILKVQFCCLLFTQIMLFKRNTLFEDEGFSACHSFGRPPCAAKRVTKANLSQRPERMCSRFAFA